MAQLSRHLTILPIPAVGHLIPLLELAKRLVTLHNFHISFLLLPNDTQSTFIQSTTLPDSIRFIHLPPVDDSTFGNTDKVMHLTLIIRKSLPNIESAILSERRETILLVDFVAIEAFNVSSKLSIPKYIFFSSPASFLSFMIYLPVLDREVESKSVDLTGPIKVPGCKSIHDDDLIDELRNRKASVYTSVLYTARQLHSPDGILVNTCQYLEPVSLKALNEDPFYTEAHTPRVYPVGPLIRNTAGESSECMTWLDKQPAESVLFVSFGSHWVLSNEQITELAQGLNLSGQRFIWVIRKPTDVESSQDIDPLKYLPEGFLDRIEGVGMVVPSWAPQVEILGHLAIGGFLSHCGWNSTLESVVNGVPMITWPLAAEQKMNATMLVDELGVAVRAVGREKKEKVVVGKVEVERVVRLLMEGEEGKRMRSKAKELRERLLKAWDEGGASYNSLSQVVQEWKTFF